MGERWRRNREKTRGRGGEMEEVRKKDGRERNEGEMGKVQRERQAGEGERWGRYREKDRRERGRDGGGTERKTGGRGG